MTKPSEEYHFDESAYDRANDDWVCGWSREGRPCPIGPTSRGRCQAEQICVPYLKEDRWRCNRPSAWGGKCDDGPLPDGSCSHPFPTCQPLHSLMARRRALTLATAVLTIGALLIALGGDGAGRFASPGAVTAAHGHIEDNCAVCHSAATGTVGEWPLLAVRGGNGMADGGLCRDCHRMDAHAFAPHGVPQEELTEITERMAGDSGERSHLTDLLVDLVPDVQAADGELACGTCHREHHGREFDLTHLGDRQCQSCHARRFDSFTHGHPEFGDYPHERRTRLHFDHGTHYGRHFALFERLMPDGVAPESCETCHVLDAGGQTMRVRGFEAACAACHAPQIEDHALPGVEFVRLPQVDVETLSAAGLDVGGWPEQTGGETSPFLELLLSADPDSLAAQEILGDIPLDDLDDASPEQLEAAAAIVRSTKRLIQQLVIRREEALGERFAQLFSHRVGQARLVELTRRPVHGPEFFEALAFVQQTWLPSLADDLETPESADPPNPETPSPATVNGEVSFGNWSVDARDQSLRFRPAGHADPLLTNWIEVSAALAGSAFQSSAVDRDGLERGEPAQMALSGMLEQITDPETAGRCMKCHTLDRGPDGGLNVNWLAMQPAQARRGFTRFSHAPHLTLGNETDACAECHTLNSDFDLQRGEFFHSDWSVNTDPHSSLTSGLQPVAREGCAECHTSTRSGESCLTCHNYHVRQFLPVTETSR